MSSSLCLLFSVLLLAISAVDVSSQDKCELHCTRNDTTSIAECHSHHPFGGCSYVLTWRGDSAPLYNNFTLAELSIYLGDYVTFDQSASPEADTIVTVQTFDGFQNCEVEEFISVIAAEQTTGTFKYDATNFYYYASRNGCELDSKVVIGVYTNNDNVACHDHAYTGAPNDDTCHCHNYTYESIARPTEETTNSKVYEQKLEELEIYCMRVIEGTSPPSPALCYQPFELLHLHYLECPGREKDATFLKVDATGLCHPAELNYGDRECPVVDAAPAAAPATSIENGPTRSPLTVTMPPTQMLLTITNLPTQAPLAAYVPPTHVPLPAKTPATTVPTTITRSQAPTQVPLPATMSAPMTPATITPSQAPTQAPRPVLTTPAATVPAAIMHSRASLLPPVPFPTALQNNRVKAVTVTTPSEPPLRSRLPTILQV